LPIATTKEVAQQAGTDSYHESEAQALTELERNRLLFDFNRTGVEFNQQSCIHELFEEQVSRSGPLKAVIFRDEALTYEELNVRSEKLAVYLQNQFQIGTDRVVAVSIKPSVELIIALLAILKAGAAYLPVDPAFPAERVSFQLQDSQADVILTQRTLKEKFAGSPAEIIVVDDESVFMKPSGGALAKVQPYNLAYLIYTSGSTGMPKGVMVEHRNVVNFFTGMDRTIGIEPGVWLSVTSISFDISVLELLWTLTHGFTVILQSDEEKLSTDRLYSIEAQLHRHKVTHFQCTPTLVRTLLRLPGTLLAMKSLRKLLVGGEPLPPALANQLSAHLSAEIYNMYGPTETTIWSTAFKLGACGQGSIPIGRPIANTSIYILDQRRHLVPIGTSGELYIGGKGVTRGYWKRPDLTAERFIINPFNNDPEDKLYKTGDLARYWSDGSIEFLGRLDHQVKIRGFRVELGEIESVFGRHPGVREVVVITTQTPAGHQQLVAFVVPRAENGLTDQELLVYARQKLPEYMIPAALVFIDGFPVTPNGKLDRWALTAVAPTVESSPASCPGSDTDLETRISKIWRDALGIDNIGLHDRFFDLGANSLVVAEVVAGLSGIGKFGVRLTDLFAYPTVSALAAYLSRNVDNQSLDHSGRERGALRREALVRKARKGDLGTNRNG
jgi:amino acid adenylation domain-containing protein